MAADILVDTGPLLALVDRRDQWHRRCAAVWQHLRFPLLTSESVLNEFFYLLRANARSIEPGWTLVRSGAITVGAITDQDLPGIRALMKQCADLPMDFADATLVHLAQRERLNTIFTVDSDFLVYRLRGRERFRVLPGFGRTRN
jgi:predicted nucleic acid-binding protein